MAAITLAHCPDCGKELHEERQVWKHKSEPTITLTCQTQGCLLHSVTLSPQEWRTNDLEVYRTINRQARA